MARPGRRNPSELGYQRVMTAPQQIAAHIRQDVLEGSLVPGMLLPSEEQLAERFGVSRPTVREAVRLLRSAHILSTERGRTGGHRIAQSASQELVEATSSGTPEAQLTYEQLIEVRHHFETMSAALAAAQRTPADIEQLEELRPLLLPCYATITTEQALQYDLLFHRRLADSSHNPLVSSISRATLRAFRACPDPRVLTASPSHLLAHLDTVLECVRARDSEGASRAMSMHLEFPRELVRGPARHLTFTCRCGAIDHLGAGTARGAET